MEKLKMKKVLLTFVPGLFVALLWAAPAQAQVAWDAPLMVSPSTPPGWGIYLIDPSPGGGIGVVTSWRGEGPLGYRIGLAEDRREDLSVFGGIDISGEIIRATDDLPIDIDWVGGAGFGAGDAFLLSFPLGIAIGKELVGEGIWFNPYLSPRVILDAYLGDEDVDEDISLEFAVDLGFDVSFESGWAVRFAGTIGDREALGIGVSFQLY
jgi:hypothetical protein